MSEMRPSIPPNLPECLAAAGTALWLGWREQTPEARAMREAARTSDLRCVGRGIWGDQLADRVGVSTDAAERGLDRLVAAGLLHRNRSGLVWAPDSALAMLNRLAGLG